MRRGRVRRLLVTCGATASAALAAGAGGLALGATPAGSSADPIRATTSPTRGFAPRAAVVAPGALVHVRNVDRARHSVIQDAVGGRPAFTSGRPTRRSFTFRAPSRPGTYSYICGVHGFMRGALVVRR